VLQYRERIKEVRKLGAAPFVFKGAVLPQSGEAEIKVFSGRFAAQSRKVQKGAIHV
jgi:hypothetical protein